MCELLQRHVHRKKEIDQFQVIFFQVCFEAVEVDAVDKCMIMLESCINKEIRSQNIYLPFHLAVIYDLRKTFPWLNVAVGTSMHVEFFESRLGHDSPYKVALKWVRKKNSF